MGPIIGIISRNYVSESGYPINIVYDDIIKAIIKSNGIPIGIPQNEEIVDYLNICQGFVFEGGDAPNNNNLVILKLLKEKNIPTLGICLGMQEMALANDGVLYDVFNHKLNTKHDIIIKKDSLLYNILKEEKILVNSRHKSAIKNSNLKVSSLSEDGVIESIEDSNLDFYMGFEWHPENLDDIQTKKIFDYFIMKCQKRS